MLTFGAVGEVEAEAADARAGVEDQLLAAVES